MTHSIQGSRDRRLIGVIVSAVLFAVVIATVPDAFAERDNEQWVGTWGTALHEPDLLAPGLANSGFNNQTLRQIVHTSVGGRQVRVRLSTFGAGSLVIGSAHIALRDAGAAIVPGSDRRLTFGGKASITIPAGAPILSDPVELVVSALVDLAVSMYVPGQTGPATWQAEARQTSYVSPPGDFTASVTVPVDATTQAWFWLEGVEVLTSRQTGTIVAFGDSITAGTMSTADANNRWPDQLARRLSDQPGNLKIGIVNKGLIGNRLLHDFLGTNGLGRFDRDVLAPTGATHVVVQLGNADIGVSWPGGLIPPEEVTVDQIIQAHKQLIERAHAKGLKIYGCTLTPFEGAFVPGTPFPFFSPANEAKRQAVNTWIRMSGWYDGVIDFDRVLRDPNSPTRLLITLDSGDHLHPNDAGYQAMADAVDLKLFK